MRIAILSNHVCFHGCQSWLEFFYVTSIAFKTHNSHPNNVIAYFFFMNWMSQWEACSNNTDKFKFNIIVKLDFYWFWKRVATYRLGAFFQWTVLLKLLHWLLNLGWYQWNYKKRMHLRTECCSQPLITYLVGESHNCLMSTCILAMGY